jgi:hypothetical protein
MPKRRLEVTCVSHGWRIAPLAARKTRSGAASATDSMVDRLVAGGRLELVQALAATAAPQRGLSPALALDVDSGPDELLILAVRHPSGALSFHLPVHTERRRGTRGRATHRFSVPISSQSAESARRGLLGLAIQAFILKVAGKIADKALPLLAAAWERASWKRRQLREGWAVVSLEALSKSQPLPPAGLGQLGAPPQRSLLLLHGTFSHAAPAFAGLGSTLGSQGQDFFAAVQPLYGDRIFAFNHFTVSRSPEENARMLLEGLPDRPTLFDCVTHSRGGLVLRHLVERRELFGALANRFELGRAVLVASPNGGTPLASPQHFDKLLGWLSNLLELLPDNPFTFAVDMVAEGLAWLAHRVAGTLPGLAAMDNAGAVIAALQAEPNPPASAYSALVANYEPDQSVLLRMADLGVDLFFNTANDLVVPTEGGWQVDPGSGISIPGARIGCFGRGGNEAQAGEGAVTHTTFFSRPESVDFIVRALRGDPQPLPPLDPNRNLPFLLRRGAPATAAPPPQPPPARQIWLSGTASPQQPSAAPESSYEDVFSLAVLPSGKDDETADLLAAFRNARVLGKLGKRGGEAGQLWHDIIGMQIRIRNYVNGTGEAEIPQGSELVELGQKLFQVLFPGDVRRLYDAARALQDGRRLNVIFTSMIDWIADKPWEFAYDPSRKNFLAVEDVNFIRNVLTAIPADRIGPRPGPLRILVVVAQPLGTAHLSVEDETNVVRSGFHHLIESGLAEVDVLLDATPDALHCKLESAVQPIDVLHFIGHGEYDPKTDMGYLLFENQQGGIQRLDSQVLRQIVCRRDIRLVFLNSCDSGRGGRADFNRGVAPALVAGGVPAVVANQYSVLDSSATSFARHFYWALARGTPIGDAARESRVAVNYSISGEAIDWAVPVVYARNPGDVLCAPAAQAPLEEAASVSERLARRSPSSPRHIIGLWDVNRVIPNLGQIADTLTGCQPLFGFQALSFSAPLGTWRREQDGGVAYLRADKIAERLESMPGELGVERIVCITNLPLGDARTRDLFAWDEDPESRISIFSTSELLDQIAPPGTSVERMIANAVVAFLGGLDSYRRHSKSCPYFYNENREIRSIAGPLKLCADCRNKLKDVQLREALESLLKVYQSR